MVGVKTPPTDRIAETGNKITDNDREESSMIERIEMKNFTAFDELAIDFVPGINLFIGDNGTGKTHILKLLYTFQTAEFIRGLHKDFSGKLLRVFLPRDLSLKRLINRGKGVKKEALFSITKNGTKHAFTLTGQGMDTKAGIEYFKPDKAVYIPVKEMLANAPGFRSLYSTRETHFEEIYFDIIDKALLPPLKDLTPEKIKLVNILQKTIGGKTTTKKEEFFLRKKNVEFEFSLVAEGMRKLSLLWILIKNGALDQNATLFWDEPETNLNPSMLPVVVKILFGLEQMGVQIFIATHSYPLLKEFELQQEQHSMRFYNLIKDKDETIRLHSAESYQALLPNKIAEQFARIYDLEIERAMGGDNG